MPVGLGETGFLKPLPPATSPLDIDVKSIKMHHKVAEALWSDNVSFIVKNVSEGHQVGLRGGRQKE